MAPPARGTTTSGLADAVKGGRGSDFDFANGHGLPFRFVSGNASFLLGLLAPELLSEATDGLRALSREDPAAAIVWVVLAGAHAFYKAEKGHNPKVRTLADALVYVSTNLSVGYCDIFATTERGKRIGALLMTFGPALAARALDETAAEKRSADEARAAHEQAVLARLDRIGELLSLHAASTEGSGGPPGATDAA